MITAGENLAYSQNYYYFEELISKAIKVLYDINKNTPFLSKNGSEDIWKNFERSSFQALKTVQGANLGEPYSKWDIELVSGHKFPDITAEIALKRKFGIEVKTTKEDKWVTLGGSIMESTRVPNVERINVLFAKLNPFEVRTKRFEDCVSDIAVTHSPRYMIDLDITIEETIFNKIGVSYNEVCNSDKPFNFFRTHFKEKAKRHNTDLWFVYDENEHLKPDIDSDELPTLEIKFFNDLDTSQKEKLVSKLMLYKPEIFAKRTPEHVYKDIGLYLFKIGILNTSLRDIFSSGANQQINNVMVPSKIIRLFHNKENILSYLRGSYIPKILREKYLSENGAYILHQWKDLIIQSLNYDLNVQLLCKVEFLKWTL